MRRPANALKEMVSSIASKSAQAIMSYIEHLENRAESAEAYAAKHAEMYVEEQNRRAKKNIHL